MSQIYHTQILLRGLCRCKYVHSGIVKKKEITNNIISEMALYIQNCNICGSCFGYKYFNMLCGVYFACVVSDKSYF